MIELLALDLVEKHLVTDQIVLTIGYDIENLTDPNIRKYYKGEITTDYYGRKTPKHAHGTANIGRHASSTKLIMNATIELFDCIVDRKLLARRTTMAANQIVDESSAKQKQAFEQTDLFTDYESLAKKQEQEERELQKERRIQEVTLELRKRFGKNAVLKGINLQDGATTIERNKQIGGHKA